MWQPCEWQAKAAECSVKAQKVADVDLRRRYSEWAARYLDIATKLRDTVKRRDIKRAAAGEPDGPASESAFTFDPPFRDLGLQDKSLAGMREACAQAKIPSE